MIELLVEAWVDFWQVQYLLRLQWIAAFGILAIVATGFGVLIYLSKRPGT
jgi:hypothetical protein